MDIMLKRILELIGDKHGARKELCDALGVKSNMVTEWEKGRNKSYPKYAARIAEYYGVSLDWLCGLADEKNAPAANDGDKSIDMVIDLWEQLTPENKLNAAAYLSEIARKQKTD